MSKGRKAATKKARTKKDAAAGARTYDPGEPDRETTIKQNWAAAGGEQMEDELENYHSTGPVMTAGDLDAGWQAAESIGDETPGGHMTTPDQDIVDNIGRAVGVERQDNQELRASEEILSERDRHRWELDRRSADDVSPDNTTPDVLSADDTRIVTTDEA
ncbi:MAG TPA: DUF6335 family protein [Blastocatellia bacterium]|nr:DUF6335 family protein [Blastocatellia bacterium]